MRSLATLELTDSSNYIIPNYAGDPWVPLILDGSTHGDLVNGINAQGCPQSGVVFRRR